MTLRAVVIGAGWAGEGHTIALRAAGVDVVALCGRTPEPAESMAAKLAIKDVRFDWRQALDELQPDIVTIATPAGPHQEIAEFAAGLGCHLICDKPLGVDAKAARTMLHAVQQAGVKHAYGSTSRYAPGCHYARQLLVGGLIGKVRELESTVHVQFSPLLPFSWFHRLELGGGALNNALTHKLGQALFITGGKVQAVMGEEGRFLTRAPVGAPIHDFRTLFAQAVEPDATTEWRAVDADMAYTVLTQIAMPDATLVSGLFKCSAMAECRNPGYLAFYGERGTLHLSGAHAPDRIEHFDLATGSWQTLAIPAEITSALSASDDPIQRDWNQLFQAFVADIRQEQAVEYPTFYDGWLHNEIIDHVRRGQGWATVPTEPAS